MIRPSAVAGTFYPADKIRLIKQINSLLEKTKKIEAKKNLKILIVPHAGYSFSAKTAAWGFKQLQKRNFTSIIIIGPSHYAHFSHAAVYNQGLWETPLGQIEIDKKLANALIKQSDLIEADLSVHRQEHCIEVQLPFLQEIFPKTNHYKIAAFKIIPILLSHANNETLESLAKAIISNFNEETLLVISSDLSHYPSYDTAKRIDKKTINAILSGNLEYFDKTIAKGLEQKGVETCACGENAIRTALIVAEKAKIKDIKLFDYSNSGDAGSNKFQVVGYASIGFYSDKKR